MVDGEGEAGRMLCKQRPQTVFRVMSGVYSIQYYKVMSGKPIQLHIGLIRRFVSGERGCARACRNRLGHGGA